jgi:hypothetical protein
MTSLVALCSTVTVALKRYFRSKGLWFLLSAGLLGVRFWVPREDGTAIIIAVNHQLPVMTSAMLGTSLGVVVGSLLLPLGFLYLRSNTTKRQPWNLVEVTPASRFAITLGSFFADTVIFAVVLAVLSVAGCLLAWLTLQPGEVHVGQIAGSLWLIGLPALMGVAALRILLDTIPATRGALGDVVFLGFWLVSLVMGLLAAGSRSGYTTSLLDFGGFIQPILYASGPGSKHLQIGWGGSILPTPLKIDVLPLLFSKAYIEARVTWAVLAVFVATAAGALWWPHASRRLKKTAQVMRRFFPQASPQPMLSAAPAPPSRHPMPNLIAAEFRLIGSGRIFVILASIVSFSGFFANYRHIVSPAILFLLSFALPAQGGLEEARGLLTLTSSTFMPPMNRRFAFCCAGFAWSVLLSLPALLVHWSIQMAWIATVIGLGASLLTITFAAISHSAFAPRLMLLILWYGYLASK